MQVVSSIQETAAILKSWRQAGLSVALAPTMGNLHAGHLQLAAAAKQLADKTVVSIFVNPAQFGANEDFASYPRTETEDLAQLQARDVDLAFLPAAAEMYPEPPQTHISLPALSSTLCGLSRPGHFDGVALVICKLLNIIQPQVLLLGEKDFQQLTVVRCLLADLNYPVQVHSVATVREADGLAMSSRNHYLTESERLLAPLLHQALCRAKAAILAGNGNFAELAEAETNHLQQAGFAVEYFRICRRQDLSAATATDQDLIILAAAKLGKTRLIDNLMLFVANSLQMV